MPGEGSSVVGGDFCTAETTFSFMLHSSFIHKFFSPDKPQPSSTRSEKQEGRGDGDSGYGTIRSDIPLMHRHRVDVDFLSRPAACRHKDHEKDAQQNQADGTKTHSLHYSFLLPVILPIRKELLRSLSCIPQQGHSTGPLKNKKVADHDR
jgi:hypothetical protein